MLPSTKCSALLQEFVTKVTPEWGQQINQVLVTNVGYGSVHLYSDLFSDLFESLQDKPWALTFKLSLSHP